MRAMRRFATLVLSVLGVALVAVLVGAAWSWFELRQSLPALDGSLPLKGLSTNVSVARDALGIVPQLAAALGEAGLGGVPNGIAAARGELDDHGDLVATLARALGPDLPLNARDGGFVALEDAAAG